MPDTEQREARKPRSGETGSQTTGKKGAGYRGEAPQPPKGGEKGKPHPASPHGEEKGRERKGSALTPREQNKEEAGLMDGGQGTEDKGRRGRNGGQGTEDKGQRGIRRNTAGNRTPPETGHRRKQDTAEREEGRREIKVNPNM